MNENIISFLTRKPAEAKEIMDETDGPDPELTEAFRQAIAAFTDTLAGEVPVTTMAIATLNENGAATMFILGETAAEMIALSAMLQSHTMRLMDGGGYE